METSAQNLDKYYSVLETFFDGAGFQSISQLSLEEKKFTYYMSMASIAGYPIALFQSCPFPDLLKRVYDCLASNSSKQDLIFVELRTFWLYLFANYGVHNVRETENNKRVPKNLKLTTLTPASLKEIGISLNEEEEKYLFDEKYFPTATVAESIELSGLHFYGKGMTTELYNTLSNEDKNKLNAYIEVVEGKAVTKSYSSSEICAPFMNNCAKWFEKARDVAKASPDHFDEHTVASLDHLIRYYHSGDEEDFKAHSKEWLRMKNPRVEYNAGFIEYYDDPMSHIGTYQSDVTIKSFNIDTLIKLLPTFEERFPFPREWKRKDMSILPNAAAAHKVMGLGGLGPVLCTIAYCLPNYNDMRSECGSKQVMYSSPSRSANELERYKLIYLSQEEREFFEKYSPDMSLDSVVESLSTTLHETIGHASGANVEGVTNEIKKDSIGKWTNGLEEMRAEILALYTGTHFYQEIADSGNLGDWPSKVPKEKIMELQLRDVAGNGYKRWRSTPVDSMEVKQAHALADNGIMWYIIDHSDGVLELKEETVSLDGKEFSVLRMIVHDMNKLLPVIEKLAIEVQKLSSNAIFSDIDEFMNKYAVSTRDSRYSGIVRQMREELTQGIIMRIQIFPEWSEGNDSVTAKIPQEAVDATLNIWNLAHKV
jgi:dipeptidyl-peptidase-3